MFRKRITNSTPDEKSLYNTKPRFIVHSTSVILKIFLILIILFVFNYILNGAAFIQNKYIYNMQLPLVDGVTYLLLSIVLIIFLWAIYDFFSWRQKKYLLTNQRIIIKEGFLRKRKSYIHYDKIEDIVVSQSLLERIFSSGDMEIFGGHESSNIILRDIPNPLEVEDMINRLIDGDKIEIHSEKESKPKESIINQYDKKFKRN
jgi:membrane protein YdbS with pleckstrin-like domain